MIDVTQTMACIQCGACVSDCLSMEVDPLFIGPAALAKSYRFVGDPRDGQQYERLKDLAEDPHGIYDCTHCFNCIEACPKGVAPMSQIMRLRRIAGADHEHRRPQQRPPAREGVRQEHREERPAARGGPAARLLRRQVPPARRARAARLAARDPQGAPARQGDAGEGAAAHAQGATTASSASSRRVHDRKERYELNLYVVGEEDEPGRGGAGPRRRRRQPAARERSPNQ